MEEFESFQIVAVDKEAAANQIALLAKPSARFQEIWINVDGWNCCVLSNVDVAWILVLRYEGDAGFSTRNPLKTDSTKTAKFMLSNGEIDNYPDFWTFDRKEIFTAMAEFILKRKFPEYLHWKNNSEDGKSRPED